MMNSGVEIPLFAYKKRFCGLPKGIKREPRIAAMFSKVSTGRMYFSLPPARNKIIVSGTKIIRDTSFVTNIDEKNTQNTKKMVRVLIRERFLVFLRSGAKMFSLLNPSRTVRSMKSVASVRQLMSCRSSIEGGVIKSEIAAARSDAESMISFLKRAFTQMKNLRMMKNNSKKIEK